MNRLYLFLTIITSVILAVHISPSFAQVADPTVGGIIVPKFTSTQVLDCLNGQCSTGGTPKSPANYTTSTIKYNIILVSLSQTCEILNKNNMKGCPSMQDIMKYDTSNQKISGKFVKSGDQYIRTSPQIKNNWLAYSYSRTPVICVECTFDFTGTMKSKQIVIQPNSFSYVNKTESENQNQWSSYANRYMQGCDVATIGNIDGLLQDTINFMIHDCNPRSTSFHGVTNYTRILHPFVMDSPYSSLALDFNLMQIFKGHYLLHNDKMPTVGGLGPGNCQIGQCSLTTSTKKW